MAESGNDLSRAVSKFDALAEEIRTWATVMALSGVDRRIIASAIHDVLNWRSTCTRQHVVEVVKLRILDAYGSSTYAASRDHLRRQIAAHELLRMGPLATNLIKTILDPDQPFLVIHLTPRPVAWQQAVEWHESPFGNPFVGVDLAYADDAKSRAVRDDVVSPSSVAVAALQRSTGLPRPFFTGRTAQLVAAAAEEEIKRRVSMTGGDDAEES